MQSGTLEQALEKHPRRLALTQHAFFSHLQHAEVSRDLAARFVGQWWHPLHYFPTFLARSIAVSKSLTTKTATSRILFEELGEGHPAAAHEQIYIDTMKAAGFSDREIFETAAEPATAALVNGYADSSATDMTALGFIYATEVADLVMVNGIGTAVRRAVGNVPLPWVDIHVQQEPGHVKDADSALSTSLDMADRAIIIETAESAWNLWIAFFDALHQSAPSESVLLTGARS
jgi:pyrroloquinoline quinone (PQQ) biosynthesis protein C